jgi:hypothetical protein
MIDHKLYIVQCDEGYFIGFNKDGTPRLHKDPTMAIEFIKGGSRDVIERMKRFDYKANEVKAKESE